MRFTLFYFTFDFSTLVVYFFRIPFAVLTLSYLRRRVVCTSACPSNPHNSTSLVSAFPPQLAPFPCVAMLAFYHTIRCHCGSRSFSVIMVVALDFPLGLLLPAPTPSTCLYFPTDAVLPLLAFVYCTHNCGWLHILVGSHLPTPARMPPTNHMPSHLQTAHIPSNNQISACMWTMPAGTDAPKDGRALGFFTPRTLFHTSLQNSFPFFFFARAKTLLTIYATWATI